MAHRLQPASGTALFPGCKAQQRFEEDATQGDCYARNLATDGETQTCHGRSR